MIVLDNPREHDSRIPDHLYTICTLLGDEPHRSDNVGNTARVLTSEPHEHVIIHHKDKSDVTFLRQRFPEVAFIGYTSSYGPFMEHCRKFYDHMLDPHDLYDSLDRALRVLEMSD